jgi:hypothetical protein
MLFASSSSKAGLRGKEDGARNYAKAATSDDRDEQ